MNIAPAIDPNTAQQAADDGLWFKDAIIYQLHVKAFQDSNGDGIGDFAGLTERLDYLHDLGVTTLWLLPFYPSPGRDDGYDISDYGDINPQFGNMKDFRRFMQEAKRRGLRVITELVVNHTSDQHDWFKRAKRSGRGTSARDWYVWSDNDHKYAGTRTIFTDTEKSNWAWDEEAGAYYWHRFFSHQPDLNFDNPRVVSAVLQVMKRWLDTGVDGFRLDAVPYLCEREGTNNENLPETHEVIRKIRAALNARYPDRMLLAEANQWPEDVRPYFGAGDECHMAYHFPLMPRIYMAIAQEDRHPITDIIRQTPDIPDTCQWAVFLRNHDELTLEMVTSRERDYLWSFYAADPRAKLNLGIRRRLAPLLDNDRRKIELLNGLVMSMNGTPIIYYGDEIGMGDNIYLGDRDGVRTPMQWSPDRNGGFSRADPARLYLPPIMDPVYGYEAVNVEAQSRSATSLLAWMKRLIATRKLHASFGRGTLEILYPANRKVLVYLRQHERETILCVANLSRAPQPVEIDLSRFKGRVPVELLGRSPFPKIGDLPYFITLTGYGFYWFLLAEETEAPAWHEPVAPPLPELLTLVVPKRWDSLFNGEARALFERRILPEYLSVQRWYGAKSQPFASATITAGAGLRDGDSQWTIALADVTLKDGTQQKYALPLGIAWEQGTYDPLTRLVSSTLARVRQGPHLGVLYDCAADEGFVRTVLAAMRDGRSVPAAPSGAVHFAAAAAFDPALLDPPPAVVALGAEQSNNSVRIADAMVLKLYRRIQEGIHPEVEMGRYLTEVAGYRNAPRLLGSIEFRPAKGKPVALAVLHEFVRNQGDGWTWTSGYLDRFLEEAEFASATVTAAATDPHAGYTAFVATLGRRVAELHQVLARPSTDPAFRPEKIASRDLAKWKRQVRGQAQSAFRALKAVRPRLADDVRARVDLLIGRRDDVMNRLDALIPSQVDAVKTRVHGDLHLGQVIVAQDDFYVIDFEGEPLRPLDERRAKGTALRDVAGMVRSFDYAARARAIDRAHNRPEVLAQLLPLARDWAVRAVEAFMAGYRAAIEGCPSWPAGTRAADGLIELFALEKALYEIAYEAANRPDWLRIPVDGVLDMLESRRTPP